MIHADSLTKAFDNVRALEKVSLRIEQGRCAALLGSNGAGKSTLLRILAGLARPTGGEARVGGFDPWSDPRRARRLTFFLPQAVGFPEGLTGREVLSGYLRLRGTRLSLPQESSRIELAAGRLGLAGVLDRRVSGYSGGMRRRLGLALLLAVDAPVLLLDEPGLSLDEEGMEVFRSLTREWRESGKTVLFSTHSLEDLAGPVDDILTLRSGRLAAAGGQGKLGTRTPVPAAGKQLPAEQPAAEKSAAEVIL